MAFFQTDNLHIGALADGAASLVLDVAGRSVNVLNRQVLTDLDLALDRVAGDSSFKLLVVRSGKDSGFLTGADLHEFHSVSSSAEAVELSARGQQLFGKLAALAIPSVAMISGACLGGGLELAMACDYRVVVDEGRTQLGLPEIELGLLPAWGGTQRLPRLVGLQRALQMILGGKRLNAEDAVRWGLADAVQVPGDDEPPAFLATPVKRPSRGLPLSGWGQWLLESNPVGRWLIYRGTERLLRRRLPDDMPAPWAALQAIRVGLSKGMETGLAQEREAVGLLATTPACRNLIELFLQREQARKLPQAMQADGQPPIRHVGVVGAGTMGAGIAQLAALKGCEVVIREVNDTALAAGILRILALFNKAAERGLITGEEYQRRLAAVHGTTAWKGFADLDLVIEAVVEDVEIKQGVFRELAQQAPPSAILATNTSSLGVQPLVSGIRNPDRIAGLHFFNPVHKMPLVEVVRAKETSAETVTALIRWTIQIGKTPVVVRDSPGFVVNRILMPYVNEAVLLASEGLPVERIDRAMRRFGMPMGPLELLDQVGLDVAAHIARSMEPVFGARFAPSPVFRRMKEKGWLGQKTRVGFYRHGRRKLHVNPGVAELLREGASPSSSAWLKGLAPDDQMHQARDRMVCLMVNEATACLGSQLAESAAVIDLAMVLGTGWAPHRGGPLRYGADRGFAEIVMVLQDLAQKLGPRFEPGPDLRRLATAGKLT
jgi:3-hydroxyacyl-CoA dehydrogenase/enoyl-CoA hydratase/3-hydroxybutyryl-CoA epimerase